jgi:hypothetical protein
VSNMHPERVADANLQTVGLPNLYERF